MQNLKIKSTTNTNSNKIIGIFAKKGQIYCSQYYCRQIMPCLGTGLWLIVPTFPQMPLEGSRDQNESALSPLQGRVKDFLLILFNLLSQEKYSIYFYKSFDN